MLTGRNLLCIQAGISATAQNLQCLRIYRHRQKVQVPAKNEMKKKIRNSHLNGDLL